MLDRSSKRLPQLERQGGKDQAWDGRDEKRFRPAVLLGDEAAPGKPDRDPDGAAGAPDRGHAAALLLWEVVAEQARPGGVVAGLSDADHGAADEELGERACKAGEEGGDAPDRHADGDDVLPRPAVGPIAEGKRGDRVDQEEGGAQEAELRVRDAEVFLDAGARAGGDPAVHVVEEVDRDHEAEHIPRVASGHGWNYEVGLN